MGPHPHRRRQIRHHWQKKCHYPNLTIDGLPRLLVVVLCRLPVNNRRKTGLKV